MRQLALPLALVVLLAAGCGRGRPSAPVEPARQVDPGSTRMLSSGEVVGFAPNAKSQAWLGIPFAAPPIGELRWRAPRPPQKWPTARESLKAGSRCPQIAGLLTPDAKAGSFIGSEDCLYLNVYAPKGSAEEVRARHLPVMFWIHGGGNTVGQSDKYDGSELAATYDVVVVTANYRLGPFGWFRHPAVVADAKGDDASGNWGTLDVIRGLEWVRDEIGAFGGDPKNVTIFGESAGGTNVFSLLVSPRAKGLFQRAIVESGGDQSVTLAQAQNRSDAKEPGQKFSSSEVSARILFPALDRERGTAKVDSLAPSELASKLRAATAEQIIAGYRDPGNDMGGMFRMPTVLRDGHVLPLDDAETLIASGRYNQVPVILGTNRDELKLFLFGDRTLVTWWFGFLPRAHDAKHYDLTAEYATLGWKMNGVDSPAAAMQKVQGANVYAYRFDWDEEPALLWSDFSQLLGAAHGLEIPFVFKNFQMQAFERMWTEKNRAGREELAGAMSSYWTNFAYTGNPGRGRSGELLDWKAWNPASGGEKYIVFDTTAGGGLRMEHEAVTKEWLFAKIASDPRLDDKGRCQMYAGYVEHDVMLASELPPAAASCKIVPKDVAAR
jgi:para-nitrobenzyl esterase